MERGEGADGLGCLGECSLVDVIFGDCDIQYQIFSVEGVEHSSLVAVLLQCWVDKA